MSYITEIDNLFEAFYNKIANAGIRNLRNILAKVEKVSVTDYIAPEMCPRIVIVKDLAYGRAEMRDQPSVELPKTLRIEVGIVDYCQTELAYADQLTGDLIDKVILALSDDASLNGLCSRISVEEIEFDNDKREGIFFSEPTVRIDLFGQKL